MRLAQVGEVRPISQDSMRGLLILLFYCELDLMVSVWNEVHILVLPACCIFVSSLITLRSARRKKRKRTYNIMKEQENQKEALVAECYARYRELLVAFAHKRTRDWEDAEDIVQDAFVRMWNMENMICVSTVRSLAFTIVQNLLVDRLRGRLKKAEAQTYLFESQPAYVEDAEQRVLVRDLFRLESQGAGTLPPACRKIYRMNRFQGLLAEDISQELCISRRTVEAQIWNGRRKVRAYLKAAGVC